MRERELAQQPNLQYQDVDKSRDNKLVHQDPPFALKCHPDREDMINNSSLSVNIRSSSPSQAGKVPSNIDHKRRQKPLPFRTEILEAERLRAEARGRDKARNEAELQKMQRLQERERMRRVIAKARGARTGKRKLGGESKTLLEKVRKMVG